MQNKVQRHQIYEIVMDQIRADIASGRLKAGDRLETVRDLAQRLGVGQSSVREAVRVLSYMGLLRVKHGGGIFITERLSLGYPPDDPRITMGEGVRTSLRHLIELRLVVEPAVARYAAERATEIECEEIRRRCDKVQAMMQRGVMPQEQNEYQDEDVGFHMAIARAAHNPLLLDTLERVHTQLRISRMITLRVPQLIDSALRFHPQITQSIIAHDMVRAENFMHAHIEDVLWWLEVYDAEHLERHAEVRIPADEAEANLLKPSDEGLLATEFTLKSVLPE